MKTILTTLMLTIGIFLMNTQMSHAQSTQRIEIKETKANFSKAVFRKALKKENLHKQINIAPLVKSLHKKNGKWTFIATPQQIKAINKTKLFSIQNNMMTGTITGSPI